VQIEVLGTGCRKCQLLYGEAEKAIARSGRAAMLTKVEDVAQIAARGVMATPALVVDGRVVAAGHIPSAEEIAALLEADTEPGP
jgi:small redox-active disulfide protein 2